MNVAIGYATAYTDHLNKKISQFFNWLVLNILAFNIKVYSESLDGDNATI